MDSILGGKIHAYTGKTEIRDGEEYALTLHKQTGFFEMNEDDANVSCKICLHKLSTSTDG